MKAVIEVHQKVWGEEHWIANDERFNYCGKRLVLKCQWRCSDHHHKVKAETFYLKSGLVILEIECKRHVMFQGDAYHVPVGLWHRFSGMMDSEIIEFSTHHDNSDSYRREHSGFIPDEEFDELKRWMALR